LPFVDPALDLFYRPQGRWKSVLKCWCAGLRPGVGTVVHVPAELKAMELLLGAVQLDDTVLRPDS
jgi:hypothetical protein